MDRFLERAGHIGSLLGGLSAVILTVGLFWQASFAKEEFLEYKNERRVSQLASTLEEFNSLRMLYARSKAAKSHPNRNPHILTIFQFFDQLANEYRKNVVTAEDIWHDFGKPVIVYWCGWKDWVAGRREDAGGDLELWEEVEKLAQDMMKLHNNDRCYSDAEIREFFQFEDRLFQHKVEYHIFERDLTQRGQAAGTPADDD